METIRQNELAETGQPDDSGLGNPSESISSQGAIPFSECVDRDNTHSEIGENEPGSEPGPGTERGSDSFEVPLDEAQELRDLTSEIVRRHNSARPLLKSKTDYEHAYRNFIKRQGLENRTLREFKVHLKEWILDYLTKIEPWSYKPRLSGLKSYVEFGMGLDWPINPRRDIGRMPKTRKRQAPRDEVVDKWLEKMILVDDPYNKLYLALVFEFGFRSHSHYARLRWSDVQWANGEPIAFRAQSKQFKTYSPLSANIPPYMRADLKKWHDLTPSKAEGDWILPWRSVTGRIEHREHDPKSIRALWIRLQKKLDAPYLRPVDLRHWCKVQMRKAGLDLRLRELRQGRDPHDQYDTSDDEDNLRCMEECLPNGIIGFHKQMTVASVDDGIPEAWKGLYQKLVEGSLSPSQLTDQAFNLLRQAKEQEVQRIAP